jgi:fructose-1,6-bisphosphatase/inositol monophosphatase family enzyme
LQRLADLHGAVRTAVLACGRGRTGLTNAKGDAVRAFDLVANDAALAFLETLRVPLLVESEEVEAAIKVGTGTPRHRLVLDPVDGSDNWARELPLSAVCCAVLEPDAPLHADFVTWAMVGPLEWEMPLLAERGSGAWHGAARCQTSAVCRIADAVIAIELNHYAPPPRLAGIMAQARGVRSYGCASRALALVACGAIDAYIDVRGRLTAESYLAAARLLLEAGGCVAGPGGAPLASARGLTDRVPLIAAASDRLYKEIVKRLNDDHA